MRFEFATSHRILFGPGSIHDLPANARRLGIGALVVLGKSAARARDQLAALTKVGIRATEFHVPEEPSVGLVAEGLETARRIKCDMVIAMGGGSAMDAAKAIAALVSSSRDIHDHLEVVGLGIPLPEVSLPLVVIPTTAGTGSEATRNAVLTVTQHRVKVSLRGPTLLPRLAIVDPDLTRDLPPEVTAASGLDAVTQLIEPFVSRAANPITDALCREGLRRAGRSLRRACLQGSDSEARADMSLAALMSGMALANAKLGAVHGLAGPIGGLHPAPHGAICARLLPSVVRANLSALRQEAPHSDALRRFDEMGKLLTGREEAGAEDVAAWVGELGAELGIRPLRDYGLAAADFPELISRAMGSSSMKGNPVVLNAAQLDSVLQEAL